MRIILDTDNEQNFVDLWNPERNNWERYIKCKEIEMCHKCHKYPCEYNQTYCEFCLGISEEDEKIEEIDEIEYYHQYDECWAKDKFYKDQKGNLVDEIIIDKVNEIIKIINEMREDK